MHRSIETAVKARSDIGTMKYHNVSFAYSTVMSCRPIMCRIRVAENVGCSTCNERNRPTRIMFARNIFSSVCKLALIIPMKIEMLTSSAITLIVQFTVQHLEAPFFPNRNHPVVLNLLNWLRNPNVQPFLRDMFAFFTICTQHNKNI